jgi:acyl-CoA thioesterase-2
MATAISRPVPGRARASTNGVVVAESMSAVRVDRPDAAPLLWFSRTEVDDAALGRLDPAQWTAGEGGFADCVAFDDEQIEVLLVDDFGSGDERDVTLKRFPTWGDVTDVIELLDVRPDGEARYRAEAYADWRRPVVEGSQILGQAIVAAGCFSPGRRVVSASMVFARAADARAPYAIELDPIANGRTFTALGVRATQGERTRAFGTLLLDVTAPDVIRHADSAPIGPGPYESTPCDMSVTGQDVRIVDDAYTGDPDAPVGPPEIGAWVRFRDVPDDQPIHTGLLAHFTGNLSIAAALRPHAGIGQDQAHRTLSTAVNAISLSIHADVRADRWLRYDHHSTFAGDGMTHAECRVHDEHGDLVASFTVDAMVRAFADPAKADGRTAM